MKKIDRLTLGKTVVLVLFLIHLLPVWIFQYFPTQDGASHIYNAYVLKEYHNHDNYRLREVYELNTTLFPNWTSHVLLVGLMYIFPPIISEKIVITLCIALLPLSLFYFLKCVQKSNLLFGLIGFFYAYNYLLHMGFYNFVLSISLYFFTVGYWWKVKDNLRWKNILIIYLMLILTYFTHYHSYALLIISITILSLLSSVYYLMHSGTDKNNISDAQMSKYNFAFSNFKPTLRLIISLIPAYCLMLAYYLYLVKAHGSDGDYRGIGWLVNYFFSMKSLVSFRDEHILIGQMLLLVFGIVFVISVLNKIRMYKNELNTVPQRFWSSIVTKTDAFLILAIIVSGMYFISPWSGYSGGWINDRFHIYIFLIMLPFFTISIHRNMDNIIAGLIIVLSLLHLGFNVHTYAMLNRDIPEALSLDGMDERHTVLSSIPGEWNGFSDSLGFEPKYVEPFGHLECLLATNMGIAYLNNYEANTDHFPLQYKNKDLTADYIIVWKTEFHDTEGLEQEYDLIDSNDYNRLYRRKTMASDNPFWIGSDSLAFDMQPNNAETALGHIAIYKDTVYEDGRFGWFTQSEKHGLNSSAGTQPYSDSITGEDDGVFRLVLPNGIYEVICYFNTTESEPIEINLIANGEHKIQQLQISDGYEKIQRRYNITITDEQLTQVIYTRGKGGYNRWAWSGFSIQKR